MPESRDEIVRIMCPSLSCRKVLAVPAKARGKTVRCRNCSTNIKIPPRGVEVKENGTSWAAGQEPKAA